MAYVDIGVFRCHDMTAAQRTMVQTVVDNLTFPFDLFGDTMIHVRVGDPGKVWNPSHTRKIQAWGQTTWSNKEILIWKGNGALDFRYTLAHEFFHCVDDNFLNETGEHAAVKAYFKPALSAHTGWNTGGEYDSPNECFAHQCATRVYAGPSADWVDVNKGGKANKNGVYRRYFDSADWPALKDIIGAGTGDGSGGNNDGNTFGFVEFEVAKDVSLRKQVKSATTQGAGKEHHLPLGFLGDPTDKTPDWVYSALLQFDITWPSDIDTIEAATLELTVSAGDTSGGSHLASSGAKSVLMATQVLHSWTEGTHGEGAYAAGDYVAPNTDTTAVQVGSVGYDVQGTRLSFDFLPFVKKWAPKKVTVASLGAGLAQSNFGVRFAVSDTTLPEASTEFASSEHPNQEWRPTLSINYRPLAQPPIAFPLEPAGNANSNIFAFQFEYADPLGQDSLGAYFVHVRNSGTSATVWDTGWLTADSNEAALSEGNLSSEKAPAGSWKAGQSYEWRVKVRSATSGKESDWTDWISFGITSEAPTVTAVDLGTKATLDNVYFGGPFTDPHGTTVAAPTGGTPPPEGWQRMTLWWPYWKSRTVAQVATAIADMQYMNLRGVVLMGKDWGGSTTELPNDVVTKLDMFINAGIRPYVGLWMGEFNHVDNQAALDAWNAGEGRWAGAVIDAEDGWVKSYNGTNGIYASKAAAAAALTTFIASLRSAGCTFVVYHGYGDPNFWDSGTHDYGWNVWNGLCDMVMPHADTPNTLDKARKTIDKYQRAFDEHAAVWVNPLPSLVWLHNGYSVNADPAVRDYVLRRGLDEQGAVSMWRYPVQNSKVRDVFHAIPRDIPTTPITVYRIVNCRIQLRAEAEGDPAWDEATGFYWDSGEQTITADEKSSGAVKRLYSGQQLPAGSYTYRVAVQNIAGAWSDWSYGTLTLTVGYNPDSGAYEFMSGYGRAHLDRRIVIRDMGTGRGPGAVKAVLYDAANIGASKVANDVGEFYFTIPTTHPQASEIEPLRRHYALEFYRAGAWRPLYEGLITDMDANEDDVIFSGIDYMGLLSKSVEASFYTADNPDGAIDSGGAKYIDKAISYVIKDQLDRGHDETDSPIGFISVEAQGSNTLMEDINTHVSINAAFRERLTFILGLIQSAKQGSGNRSRLWPERDAVGNYVWRFKNNAGTDRDNLRLEYGELVQGFHIVLLGTSWAAKVYGAGRMTNQVLLHFKSAEAPGIDTAVWGNFAQPVLYQDLVDENDLQRRVKQMAMEAGKFGKQVALGLRTHGLEPFDGFDLCDNVPITIQRGAVDTTRYGSGYWTIVGVQYRLSPDGHDETTLVVKPREDFTSPDPDLIPSDATPPALAVAALPIAPAGASVITPTMSSDKNDWAIPGLASASFVAIDCGGAARSITGFAHTGFRAGQKFTVRASNLGGSTLRFVSGSASSASGNRLLGPNAVDVVMSEGQWAEVVYLPSVDAANPFLVTRISS